jgi:hypothetical protein
VKKKIEEEKIIESRKDDYYIAVDIGKKSCAVYVLQIKMVPY